MVQSEKEKVMEKMTDPHYPKLHREYNGLIEKIDNFLETRGAAVTEFIAARDLYRERVSSTSAFTELKDLQLLQNENVRIKMPEQVGKFLLKIEEFKKLLLIAKEEYQERFNMGEWEEKLLELQKKMEEDSLKNISLPPKQRKRNYYKTKGPVQDEVLISLPRGADFPSSRIR